MKPPYSPLLILLVCFFATSCSRAGESASPEPPALMGSYHGFPDKADRKGWWKGHPEISARVIALNDTEFKVQILPEFFKRAQIYAEGKATAQDGKLVFKEGEWEITFTPEGATGTITTNKGPVPFTLEKQKVYSPNLGKKPPKEAVVLFDGKDLSQWEHIHGGESHPPQWQIVENGAMEIVPRRGKGRLFKGGNLQTKQKFGDCRLHIEFRIPYEPGKSGQGAGNSGVFFQDYTYEVQILNSYGSQGNWDECGALYKVWPPKVNASAPPGVWQSYEIEFIRAKNDDSGKVISPPIVTVVHNGVTIHHGVPLGEQTAFTYEARKRPHVTEPGVITLQDHSNPIQYRNIWVEPLDE